MLSALQTHVRPDAAARRAQAKDSWEMSDEEKVAAAAAAKDAGNAAFKAGRWARAAKKYKAATDGISYDDKFSEELKHQARGAAPACG